MLFCRKTFASTKTEMNPDTLSPLPTTFDISVFRKLIKLTSLTADNLLPLSQLPSTPYTVAKGECLVETTAPEPRFFIVVSGWLYAYLGTAGRDRQVYDIFQAGDFIGFETLSGGDNHFAVGALTTAHLIEISPMLMMEFTDRHTRLARHLQAVNTLSHLILMDRLKTIARQRPKARVAHFLLEIANRERLTSLYHDGENGNSLTFNLPMVQSLLADCIGLTAVHISRTLTWMTQEGLIERPARTLITLKDEDALIELANYQNRYADFISD